MSGKNSLAVGDEPIHFVEAIENLLQDHTLYLRISDEGKTLERDFNWQTVSERLDLFFREINK